MSSFSQKPFHAYHHLIFTHIEYFKTHVAEFANDERIVIAFEFRSR